MPSRSALVPPLLVAFVATGCGSPPAAERRTLETVDVEPSPDEALTTEFDQRASIERPEMAGVLPSDFPRDFPTVTPSSLIDFGQVGNGQRYVVFFSPLPLSRARESLERGLLTAGWSPAVGSENRATYSLGGRGVAIEWRGVAGGSEWRVEY